MRSIPGLFLVLIFWMLWLLAFEGVKQANAPQAQDYVWILK